MSCYDKPQPQSKMYLRHGKFISQTRVYVYVCAYGCSIIIKNVCAEIAIVIKELFLLALLGLF